jgi:hypothetical protein
MNNIPNIGEKIIVYNIRHATAIVSDIIWNQNSFDYIIHLSWEDSNGLNIGTSKINLHDQNKIWFREISNN